MLIIKENSICAFKKSYLMKTQLQPFCTQILEMKKKMLVRKGCISNFILNYCNSHGYNKNICFICVVTYFLNNFITFAVFLNNLLEVLILFSPKQQDGMLYYNLTSLILFLSQVICNRWLK